jgi:chromosome condensin MukBEF MukE localization factor
MIEESGCIAGPVCSSFANAASSSQDEQQFTSTSVDSSLYGWLRAGHHISLKDLNYHKQLVAWFLRLLFHGRRFHIKFLLIVRLCRHS